MKYRKYCEEVLKKMVRKINKFKLLIKYILEKKSKEELIAPINLEFFLIGENLFK